MGIKIKFMSQNIYNMKNMKNMKNNEIKNNKKTLKILLVTDRMSLGGAETHILSLYNELVLLGHFVTVVSSGGALASDIRHVTIDLTSRSPLKMLRGYFALSSLVMSENYDLIHAHARLPALISSLVAKKHKIPLVTTVHAHFKIDFLRRKLSAWGFRSIAVSEDLRIYLAKNYSITAENIAVIENGISFEKYAKFNTRDFGEDKPFNLLFLSRLDEDCSLCADILCDIAPCLAKRYGNIKISIGGGGECLDRIKAKASVTNLRFGREIISVVGAVSDTCEFMASGEALIGVSRCAIEGIATSIPVIIAGNEGFLGRLTPKNFSHALCSNFCARGEQATRDYLLFKAICDLIDNYSAALDDSRAIYRNAYNLLDISALALKYEDFYIDTLNKYSQYRGKSAENLLFGYYGFSNLGDDALLRVAIERAKSEFCSSVGALTHAPKKAAREFAIPCYSRYSLFSVVYRILRCKRLIFGGGTVFQDGTSRRSLLYYLAVLRLALLFKREVILYANGIGQMREGILRKSLFKFLSKCSHIGVRDERSLEILRNEFADSSRVCLEYDLSTYVSAAPLTRARYLIYDALKGLNSPIEKINSFFVVCPHFNASRFDRFELDIAIRTQKNKGLTPIFIPCSPYDVYICHALTLKFGGGIIRACDLLSFSDLLSIFAFSSCVISMRYHPLLAASICSVPSVVVGSDPKIDEFRKNDGE